MEELVSVIIPVYNASNSISSCIDSILKQSYKQFELLLINDGSTDSSLDICKHYSAKDSRIKVFSQDNKGVSSARNLGIQNANGDYIMFVDSDDYVDVHFIEFMLQEIHSKNCDVVRCKVITHDSKNNFGENFYGISFLINNDIYSLLPHFLTAHQTIQCYVYALIIKKDKIIFFNEDLSYMEDKEFYIRLLNNIRSIYFFDMPLYHHYINPSGITSNPLNVMNNIHSAILSNQYIRKVLSNTNHFNESLEKEMNNMVFHVISQKLSQYCVNLNSQESSDIIKSCFTEQSVQDILQNTNILSMTIPKRIIFILVQFHAYELVSIILKQIAIAK